MDATAVTGPQAGRWRDDRVPDPADLAGHHRPVPRDGVHAGSGAPVPGRADQGACSARGPHPSRSPTTTSIYGFDQPFYVQYIKWVGQLLHGNLGFSNKLNSRSAALIAQDLPKTIILVLLGTVVSLAFGIPLGLYQAVKRYTVGDYVLTGVSVPRLRHPDVLRRPAAGRVVLHRRPPVPAVRAAGHVGRPDPVPAARRWCCRCSPTRSCSTRCGAGTCAPRSWTTWCRTMSAPRGPRAPASGGCCGGTCSATR